MTLKNESSDVFFDHLTGHTGEGRFKCDVCNYRSIHLKTLRYHLQSTHNCKTYKPIVAEYPAPPNYFIVFGYMCKTCNYIQLNKPSIEKHISMYHSNDGKIQKINMSLIVQKPAENSPSKKENMLVEEAIKKDEIKPEKMDIDIFELDTKDEKEVEEMEEIEKIETVEEPLLKSDLPEMIELPKDDPTVFNCDSSIVQENIKLEEQKHEKMKEISETIIPKKKFTSGLLDRIKSRLDDKIQATEVEPTIADTSDKPLPIVTVAIVNNAITISKKVVETVEIPIKKSPIKLEPVVIGSDKPIIDKSSKPISNTIERLQGKLTADLRNLPPLIPVSEVTEKPIEIKSEESSIRVGPFGAEQKNGYTLYSCYLESCAFSSIVESDFAAHCRTFHVHKQWDGNCNICNKKIETTNIEDAFTHLIKTHRNEFIKEEPLEYAEPQEKPSTEPKPLIRMRRLSGDTLSQSLIKNSIVTESPISTLKITNVVSQAVEYTEEENHSFPFQIASVTTLTPEEEKALEATTPTTTKAISAKITKITSSSIAIAPATSKPPTSTLIPITVSGPAGETFSWLVPMTKNGISSKYGLL